MQAIASNLTADHLKLMLTLILAVLSLVKLAEIRDHRTGIKAQTHLHSSQTEIDLQKTQNKSTSQNPSQQNNKVKLQNETMFNNKGLTSQKSQQPICEHQSKTCRSQMETRQQQMTICQYLNRAFKSKAQQQKRPLFPTHLMRSEKIHNNSNKQTSSCSFVQKTINNTRAEDYEMVDQRECQIATPKEKRQFQQYNQCEKTMTSQKINNSCQLTNKCIDLVFGQTPQIQAVVGFKKDKKIKKKNNERKLKIMNLMGVTNKYNTLVNFRILNKAKNRLK